MKNKILKKVTLENLDGYGTTKAAAAADLDAQIHWLATHGNTLQVETCFGLVGILACNSSGWTYQIVTQERMNEKDGPVYGTCSFGTGLPYTDALSTMRNAMAQRAWTFDVVDDAAFIARARCLPSHAADLAHLFSCYRASAKENAAKESAL